MKKHSYGKLVNMSWNWMIQILFRPFILKKWIMLAVIIALAGQMGGNLNLNLRGDGADFQKVIDSIRQKVPVASEIQSPFMRPAIAEEPGGVSTLANMAPQIAAIPQIPSFFSDPKTIIFTVVVGITLFLLMAIFILLWIWINSNFSFVFIDSMIRNDASLRIPFHRNKPQGNSYFRWNVAFSLISLLVFGGIISLPLMRLAKAGVFTAKPPVDILRILSILLPYVPILLISGILFFLIAFFTREFILPIMYKKKIGILKGWGVFLGLFKRNIGEMLLYLLVRLGLSILTLIAAIVLTIIGAIVFLLIVGLLFLLGWLIYAITPAVAKTGITIALIIVGIPIFILLIFLFILVFIPIPVFFRIFSINVLGSIDESLDLFSAKTPEEIKAEADVEKYKKSMALVWFTVLVPILFAVAGLLLAIAIPNFIKAREKALERTPPLSIEGEIVPSEETLTIPALPTKKPEPPGETVTVHLKNGNSFKAEIKSESEYNIAFRINGGTVVFPRSDILRIE